MKKTLLLAGVAALFAVNANAMELKPYVGLDYVRSDVDIDKIGIKGSPTQVKAAYRPVIERNTLVFESKDSDAIADFIISEINNCKVQND